MDNADLTYWFQRGHRDGFDNRLPLDFTGDDVPQQWTEAERLALRNRYNDGYDAGDLADDVSSAECY